MKTIEKKENTLHTNNVILPFDKPEREYDVEKIADFQPKPIYGFTKRFVDITVSIISILLLLLPMAIVYIAVAATSKGNPIYQQERLGLNGKKFTIYKFRTMYENAEEDGAQWSKGEYDERVTPVGKVLRRIKFDEVPQFFNCLKGDLSLVGPRPEREVFYIHFETYVHGFSQRLLVKPGSTGLAQIKGGYLKPEEKIVYDLEYIKNRSLWTDFKILLSTISVIVRVNGEKIDGTGSCM